MTTIEKKRRFLIYFAFWFMVAVLFYLAMKFCLSYIFPFVIGTLAAVAVQKPAAFLAGKVRLKKQSVALLLVIGVYLLILLAVAFFATRLYLRLVTVYSNAPQTFEGLSESLNAFLSSFRKMTDGLLGEYAGVLNQTAVNAFNALVGRLTEWLSSLIGGLASGLPGFLFSVLVTVISGCYIAADYDSVTAFLRQALPEKYLSGVYQLRAIAVGQLSRFVKGYGLLSLIAFGQMAVYFLLIHEPGALKKAAVIAVVDVLPVFGVGTVLLPWAAVSLIVGRTAYGFGLVALYLFVTLVRNAAEPKIVGKQVGLHPVLALLALFIGLRLFGVTGMLLLPLLTAVLLRFAENRFLQNNGTTATPTTDKTVPPT